VVGSDLELRRRTYAFFVEHGRAPAAADLGGPDDVLAGWRRLDAEHAVVLNRATHELRMLNPFSMVPSAYRVRAGAAGGTGTARGTPSASAPRSIPTDASKRRARTAASRSPSSAGSAAGNPARRSPR
jgi:hypothetical protein